MNEMEGMSRAMSLCDRQIGIDIDGRQFVMKQLPRVPLQKILDLIYNFDEEPEKKGKKKDRTITQIVFEEWEKTLPVFARIFGYDPDKSPEHKQEFDDVVQYLDEHLPPMAGTRIFEQWYELNEIDDFFVRFGKTLMDPKLAARLKEERMKGVEEEINQIVSNLRPAAS